jgi:lysophospholipase L1-like esterase
MAKRLISVMALLFIAVAIYYVAPVWREISMMCDEDPAVWEDAIREFAEADTRSPPSTGAVLFVGSSSIRMWETLHDDMAPLRVIRRGFGGAKVNDVRVYADRIITPYQPAAVVIFVGSNDVTSVLCNDPKPADRVVELTRKLIATVRAGLPGTPVYYLAIMPAHADDQDRQRVAEVNTALREAATTDDQLFFIDANDPITGADGRVRSELLKRDGIHLNRQGYKAWAPIIRERLLGDFPAEATVPET